MCECVTVRVSVSVCACVWFTRRLGECVCVCVCVCVRVSYHNRALFLGHESLATSVQFQKGLPFYHGCLYWEPFWVKLGIFVEGWGGLFKHKGDILYRLWHIYLKKNRNVMSDVQCVSLQLYNFILRYELQAITHCFYYHYVTAQSRLMGHCLVGTYGKWCVACLCVPERHWVIDISEPWPYALLNDIQQVVESSVSIHVVA